MAEEPNGADLGIDAFGVKANVKNVKSLNTLATVFTLILATTLLYMVFTHNSEAKDGLKEIAAEFRTSNKEVAAALKESNKELSEVLKEMARASRETNCLLAMPPEKRAENVELCKRISR